MDSQVLDVAIGLVFIFTLYSLLVTIINEIISTVFHIRGRVLATAIERMLEDETGHFWNYVKLRWKRFIRSAARDLHNIFPFVKFLRPRPECSFYECFYESPTIKFFGKNKIHKRPAYLSASTFSRTVIDLLQKKAAGTGHTMTASVMTLDDIRDSINGNTHRELLDIGPQTREHLMALSKEAKDIGKFKELLEKWFDEMMTRAGGWYKRKTKWASFGLGLIIAVIFNVDTIRIVSRLNADSDAAAKLSGLAQSYVETNKNNPYFKASAPGDSAGAVAAPVTPTTGDSLEYEKTRKKIQALLDSADALVKRDIEGANSIISIGWGLKRDSIRNACDPKGTMWGPVRTVCVLWTEAGIILSRTTEQGWMGYFITALAISLGAPFWFDLLNKLVKLRGSGDDPDKKNVKVDAKLTKVPGQPGIESAGTEVSATVKPPDPEP